MTTFFDSVRENTLLQLACLFFESGLRNINCHTSEITGIRKKRKGKGSAKKGGRESDGEVRS